MLLFDTVLFKSQFQHFKTSDEPTNQYSFGGFWKWKLITENETTHVLDWEHLNLTYEKLSKTLRKWRWARSNTPNNFEELAPRLLSCLKDMQNSYDELRRYSLLEIENIPNELLRNIWDKIGCVKSLEKNPSGNYLVMGATKPLLFLWGQTPAFDSVVRKKIPKFGLSGIGNNRWNFETWKRVLINFKNELEQQQGLIDFLKQTSRNEYGNDVIIPYGQFIDLYFWTEKSHSSCKKH